MNTPVKVRKKLIEVALPLEAINKASAREKSIRHGHPSNLHRWWARRPFVSARAVIFAQMVDDPSEYVDQLKDDAKLRRKAEAVLKARSQRWKEATAVYEKARKAGVAAQEPGPEPKLNEILAEAERQRLFRIIEDLVQWENTTNEEVLQKAREEIWQSWRRACVENVGHPRAKELFDRHKLPAFHDPFAGGGALPLEAQRLGLEAHASDLNPVAVLICKAMIEIPPKFANRPPVNPDARRARLNLKAWRGLQGLANDVRYYGQWMRDEANKQIGHLYPKIEISAALAQERPDLRPLLGQKLTVIAWLWARTVKSPNPAFRNVDVPLASSFMLANKAGKEAYVEPVVAEGGYRFTVKVGRPKDPETTKSGTKLARGANFRCVMSDAPIAGDYIKAEGKAGRMGTRLMAIVAEGRRGRVYLPPTPEHESAALEAKPAWRPDVTISGSTQYLGVKPYGMERFDQLFTSRQLVALNTFSELLPKVSERIRLDAIGAGHSDDQKALQDDGNGATAYAQAVVTYLAIILSKAIDSNNALCPWEPVAQCTRQLFGRQAISMLWDFGEANLMHDSSGGLLTNIDVSTRAFETFADSTAQGSCVQMDATTQKLSKDKVVSTDPPYYDNVPYADLSDFFYVWLRRAVRPVFPDLFATLAVPKSEELVAFAYRHENKPSAEAFFLKGMSAAMNRLEENIHCAFPVAIYYAFKQAETESDTGTASTGWETFLDAVIHANFAISGTWPMRTEMTAAMKAIKNNLASSIILVCRPRPVDSPTATRRDFVAALQQELPEALRHLQAGNIAPVDLAQAAIGPGMAVFTRYAKVLDAQDKPLSVRDALKAINQVLDTALAEQEGDFDSDSRWAITWFEENGFSEGEYGRAEQLSKSKNTSVAGIEAAGIAKARAAKVRLLKPNELPVEWDPTTDARLTHWEIVHHLIRALEGGGESAAAEIVGKLGSKAEIARELCYRLYTLCERKKRAAEALSYNALVQSWPEIIRLATQQSAPIPIQQELM